MASTSLARAAVTPVGLGLGVAAVIAGLLAGSLVVGVLLGVVLWLAATVLTMLKRTAAASPGTAGATARGLDPFTLGEPWRFFARDALQAQARFRELVGKTPAGPTRDRLADIGQRLDEGVQQVWATAQRGNTLRQARQRIDVPSLGRRLGEAQRAAEASAAADPLSTDDVAARTVASLQGQLDSASRLDEVTAQAEKRLRLLQAQLDESVTRAAELSASVGDVAALAGVGTDIEHLVEEMEALRLALEESGGLSAGSG
ncbi:MAG: hypothetical protein GEV08_04465 [Acidimicrobiia bacterium]|nr:hypothetical protein [Acidimicrobiia bacterium]